MNSAPEHISKPGSSHDRLLGGKVSITQPVDGYRVSIDAVLLASAVPDIAVSSVLDVGCGDGGATLCLAWRASRMQVSGIDVRADALDRFAINVALNGWQDRISGRIADVSDGPDALLQNAFDWVISNPPYLPVARMDRRSATGDIDPATTETVPLHQWIGFMFACLRDGGHMAMVHRADRMDEILAACAGVAGGLEVFPIWPKAGAAAKRVIVTARKGARAPASLHNGLVLHEAEGAFTAAARRILEDGEPLKPS